MPLLPLQASAPSVVMRLLKDIGQVFPFQKSSSTPPPRFVLGLFPQMRCICAVIAANKCFNGARTFA